LVDQLYPLFEPNLVDWLFTPTNRERTAQLVQACEGRAILQDDYTFGVPRTNGLSGGSKRKRDDEEEQEKRQRQQRLIGFLERLEFGLGLNPSATGSTLPLPVLPESRPINKIPEEMEENGRRRIPEPSPLPTTRITPSALAHVRTGLAPLPSKILARPSQLFEVPVDLCPRPVPCPRQTPNGPVLHRLSTSATNGEVAWFDNDTPPASTKTPIDSSNYFGFRTNLATSQDGRGLTSNATSAPQSLSDIPDDRNLTTTTRSTTPLDSQIASTSSSTVPSTNASTPFPFSRDSSAASSIPSSTVTSPGPSAVEAAALALERDYPLSSLSSHRSDEGEPVSKRVKTTSRHIDEEEGEEREEGSPGRGRRKLSRKRKDQVRKDSQDDGKDS